MQCIVFEDIHLSSIVDVPVCTITINASNQIYPWPLYLYGNKKKQYEYIEYILNTMIHQSEHLTCDALHHYQWKVTYHAVYHYKWIANMSRYTSL
jgi:hypothetical protein